MSQIWSCSEVHCKFDLFYSKAEFFGKEVIINVKQRLDERGKTG